MLNLGNRELKIFSRRKGYAGTTRSCRSSDFAMSSRQLKILDFTLFYPHMAFKISHEGNRRKEIKNEISAKVFLDVDTVNTLYKYDLEDDI